MLQGRCFMFFLIRFHVCFNHFVFLFLVSPCLVVAIQPCMDWISIKTKNTYFLNNSTSMLGHVYMRPEVNSSRSEISNCFGMLFPLHGSSTVSNLKISNRFQKFALRFHCSNFLNHGNTLLHMCKWYFLINVNLIDGKQMLRRWFFFKQ